MDQFIFASLSHTHYWYEVGMLKVPAESVHEIRKTAFPVVWSYQEMLSENVTSEKAFLYHIRSRFWVPDQKSCFLISIFNSIRSGLK